jgi:hypothetical protein
MCHHQQLSPAHVWLLHQAAMWLVHEDHRAAHQAVETGLVSTIAAFKAANPVCPLFPSGILATRQLIMPAPGTLG